MRDYSPSVFLDASGQQYSLLVVFKPELGDVVVMDGAGIRQLDYTTQFNDLVARGQIVYTDAGGKMDSALHRPGGQLRIMFSRIVTEFDGDIAVAQDFAGSPAEQTQGVGPMLDADFLVENVSIYERQNEIITYALQFTSANIVGCLKTLDFSNYGKKPEPVLGILKQLAQRAGVDVSQESFDMVAQRPAMNYITNGNDNLFTASKFLLDKLYYVSPRAESMTFIFWNELYRRLQLFDTANIKTATGQTGIALSMFESQNEALAGGVKTELGTVTKFPTSQSFRIGYRKQVALFDYGSNRFEYDNISPESSYQYINSRFDTGAETLDKYNGDAMKSGDYIERGSVWNNNFHFYGTFSDVFLNDNALMVRTCGEISRIPGGLVGLTVDKGQHDLLDEDPKLYEDVMARYMGLEGTWFISKAHHVIRPGADKTERYRQTLTLVRNFDYDLDLA